MALTHAFQEAVSEGNVRRIRIMLKDSLLVDPSFGRFNEMERAASLVKGLYDEHDGRSFNENPEEWDDSYMDKIMVQVVSNFSHERVNHLKEVVRKLRPVSKSDIKTAKSISKHSECGKVDKDPVTYEEQKKRDQQDGRYRYAVGIGTGGVLGGVAGWFGGTISSLAVGGVVGCAGGGAGIGAIGGGAVVYYTSIKE